MRVHFAPSAPLLLFALIAYVSEVRAGAPQSTVAHARELMGSGYAKSRVAAGEKFGSPRWLILGRLTDRLPKKWRSSARALTKTIQAEARRYSLDPLFVLAVIETESSFNPEARGDSGEIGLMQLLPSTARWIARERKLGWKGDKQLSSPSWSVRFGTAYIDFLRKRFDAHSRLYISAYNMGPKNVERSLEHRVWPKDYAKRVMTHYLEYYDELQEALAKANRDHHLERMPASVETRSAFEAISRASRTEP